MSRTAQSTRLLLAAIVDEAQARERARAAGRDREVPAELEQRVYMTPELVAMLEGSVLLAPPNPGDQIGRTLSLAMQRWTATKASAWLDVTFAIAAAGSPWWRAERRALELVRSAGINGGERTDLEVLLARGRASIASRGTCRPSNHATVIELFGGRDAARRRR